MERPDAAETRRRARKLEQDLKTLLQGSLTPRSGSGRIKGDAQSSRFVGEAKYRWQPHAEVRWVIPVLVDWLATLNLHAEEAAKVPVLALEWGEGTRGLLIPASLYQEGYPEPDTHIQVTQTQVLLGVPLLEGGPLQLSFEQISQGEQTWVLLPWEDFRFVRQQVQPAQPSPTVGRGKKGGFPKRGPKTNPSKGSGGLWI